MRDQARRLDEDQKKLSDQLEAAKNRPQRGPSRHRRARKVTKGLDQQQKRLEQLMDQMRRTVEDAEETEPLLAKGLYDTVRKAPIRRSPTPSRSPSNWSTWASPRTPPSRRDEPARASNNCAQGVEHAARSVLGDETAALKRAQGELEDLADQVNREIAQATGQEPTPQPGRNGQNDRNGSRTGVGDPQQKSEQSGDPFDSLEMIGPGEQARQKQQEQHGRKQPARTEAPAGPQSTAAERGFKPNPGKTDQGNEPGPEQRGQGEAGGQEGQQKGQGQQGGRQSGPRNRGGGGGRETNGIDRLREGGRGGPGGPITGEGFRQWSDRMRDVEELLDDPELRAEAARIRDRARGAREEFKRHSKVPDWTKLKDWSLEPINELRDRIAEEVRRRESPDSLVPDRSRSCSASVRRGRAALLRTIGEWSMTIAVLDLGITPMDGRRIRVAGCRAPRLSCGAIARARTKRSVRIVRRSAEGRGFHGAGSDPDRTASDRHAAATWGQRVRRSWPITARAC